jgi:cyclohexanone monooxygenase
VLSNMPVSIEQHVEWIGDCLAWLRGQGAGVIEATDQAAAGWTDHVQQVASGTLHPKAATWYMGANIPGKPRVFLPYIGGVGNYRDHCATVAADGYQGFAVSGEEKGDDGTRPGDHRAA